jgi:IMP dehydrogenase/GMP reductase
MKINLTYDDVQIVPKYSELKSREDVNLTTRFTKNTELTIPIVASPMDTVTELDMAKEMMDWGGVGVIHRFQSIKNQSRMMQSLHYEWDRYFEPIPGITDGTERTIENEWQEWWDSSVRHWNSPPTKSDWDDLKERFYWADSLIQDENIWKKRPLCAAIGVTGDFMERAQELVNNGCNVLLIDVAHGHHNLVKEAMRRIKNEISTNVEVVAGSIATKRAAEYLIDWGADALRVGIGNGSLCETRIRTGVGVPQFSALVDVCSVSDNYSIPCIADGGVRYVGDVAKSLGAGADSVMVGSLLSGTKETPGEIIKQGEWPDEKLYKKYRGSASLDSKADRGESKNVEGNSKLIPYKGKTVRILNDIRDGLRSAFSYVGASDTLDFQAKCKFIRVTQAGQVEAKPHLLG